VQQVTNVGDINTKKTGMHRICHRMLHMFGSEVFELSLHHHAPDG